MKITRRQLRRLIAEAAKTIIVDPEGIATPADDAFKSGFEKDKRISLSHPKLGDLMGRKGDTLSTVGSEHAPFRRQGRELADSLGLEEPLTPAEETAVDSMGWNALRQDYDEVESLYDMDTIINLVRKGKAGKSALKTFGVEYVEDVWPDDDYGDDRRWLQHIANTLGCEIHELGLIPMERDDRVPLHHQLSEFLYRNVRLKNKNIKNRAVQDENGHYNMMLYNYNGVKFLHESAFGGFKTIYFCSK